MIENMSYHSNIVKFVGVKDYRVFSTRQLPNGHRHVKFGIQMKEQAVDILNGMVAQS